MGQDLSLEVLGVFLRGLLVTVDDVVLSPRVGLRGGLLLESVFCRPEEEGVKGPVWTLWAPVVF